MAEGSLLHMTARTLIVLLFTLNAPVPAQGTQQTVAQVSVVASTSPTQIIISWT